MRQQKQKDQSEMDIFRKKMWVVLTTTMLVLVRCF